MSSKILCGHIILKFNLTISVFYVIFSLVATTVNLLTQKIIFSTINQEVTLYLAMVSGTLAGLIVKYVLDKKWIFKFAPVSKKEDLATFFLYTCAGIFTTFVFIVFEMTFYYFFDFEGAQYVGGAIGLSLGYTLKYFLDKKYVFTKELA